MQFYGEILDIFQRPMARPCTQKHNAQNAEVECQRKSFQQCVSATNSHSTAQHSTNMWTHRQTRAFNVKWCNNLANRTINDPLQHAMSLESLVDTQFKSVFKICLNGWRRFSLLLLQSSKLWMLNYKLTEESHNTQKKWYPVQVSIKWKTSAVTVIVKLETICADGKDQIKL